MDCPASLERVRRAGGRLDEPPPTGAALVLGPGSRIELGDVVDTAHGWRYGGAELRGASPWGEHIVAHLRRGNRVDVLPRLLFIYRDHELIAAIPHGVIVPICYGVPNRFHWRGKVARQVVPAGEPHGGFSDPAAAQSHIRDLLPQALAGTTVGEIRADGAAVLLDLGVAGVTLELRLDDDGPAYLRGGGVTISYRLCNGATFSPAVDNACRALLDWAQSTTAIPETLHRPV
jgi:hypothetical protein